MVCLFYIHLKTYTQKTNSSDGTDYVAPKNWRRSYSSLFVSVNSQQFAHPTRRNTASQRTSPHEIRERPLFLPCVETCFQLIPKFNKSQKELERDDAATKRGGLNLEEILAIIMYADSTQVVINLRMVSKHVYSAFRHMKTNPFYSEKKLNKSANVKKRIVNARKDVLLFRNLKCLKGQLETFQTIKDAKLQDYKSFVVINDFSSVDNNIFNSIKSRIIDLTLVIYPEIEINFEGLTALKTLKIDFNNNEVTTASQQLLKNIELLKKNIYFKELFVRCNGKYAASLGKMLKSMKLVKQQIVVRFDRISENECVKFLSHRTGAIVLVMRNDLDNSILSNSVQIIPDNEGVYHISSSLVLRKRFLADFVKKNCPSSVSVCGKCECSVDKIDMTTCTTLTALTLNECKFSDECALLLPTSVVSFGMVNIDYVGLSNLVHVDVKQLEFVSCNTLSSLTIPPSVTSLSIDKCISLSSIDNLNKANVHFIKIAGCSNVRNLNIPTTLESLSINDCKKITHLLNLENAPMRDLNIKYCGRLSVINLPQTLTLLHISNCEKLVELMNFSEIKLLDFESSGPFNVDNLVFPKSMTHLEFGDYEAKNTTTLTNLTDLNDLKVLTITNAKFLEMLAFPPNLTGLILHECHTLTFYPNLMELNLQFMDITHCDALTCLSFPTTLTKMNISNCQHVTEFPNLEEMTNLKELDIDQCSSLEVVYFPLSITKLKVTKCKNLLDLPNIHELNIPFKHLLPFYYNLKTPLIPTTLSDILIEAWECVSLPNLECLHLLDLQITNCSFITSLSCPTTVTFLEMNGCKAISKICNLPKLKIQILKICYCSSLKSLKLPTTVSKLVMYDDTNISISNSKKLPLKSLYMESLENLKSIALPTTLTKLEIKECTAITSLPGIASAQIEEMHLFLFKRLKTLELPTTVTKLILDSFKMLTSLDNLEKISMSSLKISGMKKIQKLKFPSHLTKLEMCSCSSLKTLQISNLPLAELSLFMLDGMKSVELPTGISKLRIDSCPIFTLSSLANLKGLKLLEMIRSPMVETVVLPETINELSITECGGLKALPGLEKLKLNSDTLLQISLTLESPILTQKMMEGTIKKGNLEIKGWKCKNLNSIESIDAKKVVVTQCDQLSSIEFGKKITELEISDCTALVHVGIDDGGLTLFNLKNCIKLSECSFPSTLKTLRLHTCGDLYKIDVSRATDLTRIDATQCNHLQVICAPQSLKIITVDNCDNFEKIDNFKESGTLECFINECDCIEQISPPTCITKLSIQKCYSLNTVVDIDSLVNLPRDIVRSFKILSKK
ncbi:hypothetical protein EIN_097720 [Entamoeba invadens IP1]|uniref:Leucine-rich repeat containing protein n=1 Tax=Entamoeba invadens IP1 TaxID=370355 RepID=A0A0A1U0Q7_ENTIV|nr:hypothetical protein EIN_097720 [Entamoeba invadens IP1]ELP87485.1 hypothetical protein EIN_097720 [Entamoeba invadens IP1]|eukprot:XP_004254256.1 hypothetical protein EIN_097720 [Entamoeba invadens IP1]